MLEITYKGGYSVILDTMYKIGIQVIGGIVTGCVLEFLDIIDAKMTATHQKTIINALNN